MKLLFVETLVMLRVLAATSLSVTALTLTALGALAQPAAMVETIKLGEVEAAQEPWCEALVAIFRAHAKGGLDQSKPLAGQVIDGAYGYQYGPVAFKPTWAKGETTFRKTRAGAGSYFVGDNAAFDNLGFAIGTAGSNRSP